MQQLLIAIIAFGMSISYVLLLSNIATSVYALQKAVVFPIMIFFLFLYFSRTSSWGKTLANGSKWILLFPCTTLIYLLILSTGALKSPFLILIHLSMVGLAFLFSFSVALLFLLSSFVVLLTYLAGHQALIPLLQNEPTLIILQIISLISIAPVAYIVSQHYHFKDMMVKKLNKEVIANQAILESLNELIIITDLNYTILSVNDAVVKILHKSKSELLNTPIFDTLFLKDKAGNLITKENFPLIKDDTNNQLVEDFILMKTSLPQQKVSIQAQAIKDPEGIATQISFIISTNSNAPQSTDINIEKTRTLYEAMAAKMKKDFLKKKLSESYTQIVMIEKFNDDITQTQALKHDSFNQDVARIDIAQLCKQTVLNLDFAKAFHVPTDYAIHNFTMKDIQPLISDNFQLKPEHFTGPFFTVECDAKHIEILMEKLLDLAILLAATQKKPQIILSVERAENQDIIVDITGSCTPLVEEELSNLFIPYYGKLANITNLHSGSGLEGYLVKTISDGLGIPLETKLNNANATISFILHIPKKIKA